MKDAGSLIASGKRNAPKAINGNMGKRVTSALSFPPGITMAEVEVFAALLDRIGVVANDNV